MLQFRRASLGTPSPSNQVCALFGCPTTPSSTPRSPSRSVVLGNKGEQGTNQPHQPTKRHLGSVPAPQTGLKTGPLGSSSHTEQPHPGPTRFFAIRSEFKHLHELTRPDPLPDLVAELHRRRGIAQHGSPNSSQKGAPLVEEGRYTPRATTTTCTILLDDSLITRAESFLVVDPRICDPRPVQANPLWLRDRNRSREAGARGRCFY